MIKSIKHVLIATLLAVAAIGVVLPVVAADKPAPADAKKDKPKRMPFGGKIKAIDKTAKTITIDRENKNTFALTSETKVTRHGKPATFDDAAVGDEVGGLALDTNGKLELLSLRLGAKPGAEEKPKDKAKKAK